MLLYLTLKESIMQKQINAQIAAAIDGCLDDIKRNGQNGAMSAGGGSFNAMCRAVAMRTGVNVTLVEQIASPRWDAFWEYRREQGLDMWPDQWHVWKI